MENLADTSDGGGGGIACYHSSPLISNNTIANNIASEAGGIQCALGSPIIDKCTIINNFGDGVRAYSSSVTIQYCSITGNEDYAVKNTSSTVIVNAEYNWWGDSTGPYHPDSNPGGLGDPVSDYVDFIPWLYWPGVEEQPTVKPAVKYSTITSTIFAGPLSLPEGKECKVIDITGRIVLPQNIKPGIYFIEIDGKINSKVIKIR